MPTVRCRPITGTGVFYWPPGRCPGCAAVAPGPFSAYTSSRAARVPEVAITAAQRRGWFAVPASQAVPRPSYRCGSGERCPTGGK